MIKKAISLVCIATFFCAVPAFSYQREKQQSRSVEQQPVPSGASEETNGGDGNGLLIASYAFIGLGSAAAIAGSAIATASSKKTLGVIVGSSGAALGLAGSFMLLFAARKSYGLAPKIDPANNSYGLIFAANF